jgi:ribosomal protein L37AE/L43A
MEAQTPEPVAGQMRSIGGWRLSVPSGGSAEAKLRLLEASVSDHVAHLVDVDEDSVIAGGDAGRAGLIRRRAILVASVALPDGRAVKATFTATIQRLTGTATIRPTGNVWVDRGGAAPWGDASATELGGGNRDATPARYAINPFGFGLVVLGAAVAVIGTFLPRAESTALSLGGIKDNTLLQSGGGIGIIIGAVVLAAVAYSAWTSSRKSWAILVVSAYLIGQAFYQGSGSRISLYRITPFGGQGAQVESSAGVGIYAVGVGGLLGFIGGWMIRRGSPLLEDTESDHAPRDQTTKRCPDCAETVLAAAKVCKHCGYRFAPTATEHETVSAKLIAEAEGLREAGAAADALRNTGASDEEVASAKLTAYSEAIRKTGGARGPSPSA